jgi:hypothetical protein
MWNNKLIIGVLVVLLVVVIGVISYVEQYHRPSRTWKVERMYSDRKGDYFQSPNFQSLLSPRFSNVNYGPNLRTQFPEYSKMGVPQDPLGSGVPLDPHSKNQMSNTYANGNYNNVVSDVMSMGGGPVPTDTVARGGGGQMLGPNGEIQQPIVYDRYIYANRKSKLRAGGDPIRGDLPIVPDSGNWFTPSVHPNIDLQQGAINVLAGVDNTTNKQLANLIYNSSGRADTTIGGVNMADVNMAHNNFAGASAAGGDVTISAFP